MLVFVKNKHGENLMPCKPSKARKLLKQKKAKIISYKPFTIQQKEENYLECWDKVYNAFEKIDRLDLIDWLLDYWESYIK